MLTGGQSQLTVNANCCRLATPSRRYSRLTVTLDQRPAHRQWKFTE